MLQAQALTAGYNQAPIIHAVDLSVAHGEFVGVVGPNGCGKSTLVRALSRVLPPLSGRVLLDGTDIYQLPARRLARRLAVVTQESPLAFYFTVREVVLMGRAPHLPRFALEGPRDLAIAYAAMERTHTLAFADRPITALSGGERQRCLIARALTQEPDLLLLDEPTAHLDVNHQIEVLDLARTLTAEQALATIIVLHDLNLASQYCDRLALMARGRVIAAGPPAAVITEANLRHAYGTELHVRAHPATGRPYVTLLSRLPATAPGNRTTRVHLICGAGTGISLMRRLRELGFEVSVGVVNVADSDQVEAESLDLPRVEEAPFSPISPETQAANLELIRLTEVVVVTATPFGRGNLPNLIAAGEAIALGKRVLFVDDPPIASRDFAQGEARALQQRALQAGAESCREEAEVIARLELLP